MKLSTWNWSLFLSWILERLCFWDTCQDLYLTFQGRLWHEGLFSSKNEYIHIFMCVSIYICMCVCVCVCVCVCEYIISVQSLIDHFNQSCLILCDPMDRGTPGFPVHYQCLEPAQTHVHQVGDAIQPSHPLSSASPPAFNLSQHQIFSNESVLLIKWPNYWNFSF